MKLLQIDPRMPHIIRTWGCNFRSLLAMIEEECGKVLKAWEILRIWMDAFNLEYLDRESAVDNPDGLLRLALTHWSLSGKYQMYQIGADGVYWKWVKLKRVDYTILKGRTVNGNEHFRLGDREGSQIFDPNPRAKITKELSIIYYQCLRTV